MEERLRNAPCGFLSINENGCIEEVNETFLDWMEYKKENLIGKHIESLLPMSTRLIFHSYFFPNINLHGYIEELFISCCNASGQSIPFLLNARYTEWKGEKIIDCILVQMKKRMDYEQELRVTKRKMEEAYIERGRHLPSWNRSIVKSKNTGRALGCQFQFDRAIKYRQAYGS